MNAIDTTIEDAREVNASLGELTDHDLHLLKSERRFIRYLSIGVVFLLIWAAFFQLDIATQAYGEVAPADQVQKVQHLEGGIVREIHVKEGQKVKKGDPLVELEGIAAQADKQEIDSRIGALRIKIIRLEAVIGRKGAIEFPADLLNNYPKEIDEAKELYRTQLERSSSTRDAQTWKIVQRQEEFQELKARIAHLSEQRKILREQLRIDKELLDKGIGNQYEFLQRTREDSSLSGQILESQAALRRVEAGQKQEQSGLTSITSGNTEDLRKDLEESRKQLAELQKRLGKFQDSTARTIIRSPVDGTVFTLYTVTRGGVVSPGGLVVSLVPGDERIVIETKLNAGEVGLVSVGQLARLRLEGGSTQRFRPVDGKVLHISSDAITEPQKPPYFLVRIAPSQLNFTDGVTNYKLSPGVQVSASIVTGHRSVLQYVFGPMLGRFGGALTEH
ncbi:HlyD family type I secretion periplasmic adaptor subunit [Limnohabitans sp. yimb22184]|uniref:HlyD family type I secretion periplasmic adaptor subunit n=1 Tax=Limnohabitans sp. YIMB22184 TaxID=3374104 RepID=UPI003A8444D0